jgi:hypothetical protein
MITFPIKQSRFQRRRLKESLCSVGGLLHHHSSIRFAAALSFHLGKDFTTGQSDSLKRLTIPGSHRVLTEQGRA